MNLPKINKPSDPRFSCGPTKKPEGWSLNKINKDYLGRYHRSNDVKSFIDIQLKRIKRILKIPDEYKVFLTPGSCTGAMSAVIWSLLGERKITAIIYDYWGVQWFEEIKKLNYKIECRLSLDGSMPFLDDIPLKNDLLFVWSGTSTGISLNNLNFLNSRHEGLVVSDVTSAAFIYDLPWKKIDISVFSWQKALGSESQHGIIVMSPKALKKLKKKSIPKLFNLFEYNFVINTPSLLTIADLELCLDLYEKNGGLNLNKKISEENKYIIDNWEKNNCHLNHFVKEKKYQAISPVYLKFSKKIDHNRIFEFLSLHKIAYDIRNYRLAEPGVRIWTGPTIKKNDLIALTNWLDWCFNKFV